MQSIYTVRIARLNSYGPGLEELIVRRNNNRTWGLTRARRHLEWNMLLTHDEVVKVYRHWLRRWPSTSLTIHPVVLGRPLSGREVRLRFKDAI